jgi:thioesterase domain-containing protein
MPHTPALAALAHHYQAMPPVAAMRLTIAGYDEERLRLRAPLAVHVNDKGCAFGGSLASLMTLAGWGLLTLRLQAAGLAAEVYVAESTTQYRAPLYADLEAAAWLAERTPWDQLLAELRERGRLRAFVNAAVYLPDGTVAAESRARFVAIAPG